MSFSPQINSVNDEFDQGSQSGEEEQSGGATALGTRPQTRKDKKTD